MLAEAQIQGAALRWAEKRDIAYLRLMMGRGAPTGWPDVIFWLDGGCPVLIEFKRSGGKPRKRQTFIHKQLRDRGYYVYVCDIKGLAETILAAHLEAREHGLSRKREAAYVIEEIHSYEARAR